MQPFCQFVYIYYIMHSDKVSIRLKNYACIISVALEHVYTPHQVFSFLHVAQELCI